MKTVYKNYIIRTLRNVNLMGNPEQDIDTESDARILANFIMTNIPASTTERLTEILEKFADSPEPMWKIFLKNLSTEEK